MPKPTTFETPPTGFYRWGVAHPEWTDERIADATKELHPEAGISLRTVRRIRYGDRSDSKGIYLLMRVTGLAFSDFLACEFLEQLGQPR